MQSMQRQFGKLMSRGPGDNAKVSVILNDYEDADRVLAKIIESAKSWRDSWMSLLSAQLAVVTEYESLYDPIVGASDGHGREPVATPEPQLTRTFKLKEAYAELKEEVVGDVGAIDEKVIRPATDARDSIAPVRKTIKKRENKRLDYERCQDRVTKLQRKQNRSAKEEASLAKAEDEMKNLGEEFEIADGHLRETLPPLITAAFSLIPPLLAAHVYVQNRLMGMYYTILHNYCEEHGFPSPAPPMEEVVAQWSADFKPVQREAEAITCIARGKAVREPMRLGDDNQGRKPSTTSASYGPRDGFRRSSSSLPPSSAANGAPGRAMRIPSNTSVSSMSTSSTLASPQQGARIPPSPGPNFSDHLKPTDFTTATVLGQSPGNSPNSVRSRADYFGNGVTKKRPPPPPPPKKFLNTKPEEFVIALYPFTGEGADDLSFNEGDRIKIIKKTDTSQDWWVGELAGIKGNFPANYCREV